jgi:hypothetical protein
MNRLKLHLNFISANASMSKCNYVHIYKHVFFFITVINNWLIYCMSYLLLTILLTISWTYAFLFDLMQV